ncbi:MAG TPA: LysM peptidoglycan-binding domain-containing protein, partial [Solirubrobacterales bacterium]
VGDNVDPASATVVAQPVTREVGEGESLAEAAQWFEGKWGRSLAAAGLASLNADVPQLLRLGAELSIPGQPSPYPVEYGDTFGSIARAHGVSVEALAGAGANATAPILATGAQLQFAPGVLSPSTTAPPGTAGFELVRVDPDPENLPHAELGTAQLVDSLFNLLSWRIGEGGGFLASGEGLPTTPTEAGPDWSYSQSLAAAPFAEVAHGSVSTALPPAAANPYNGIGVNNGPGELELKLALQDVYGNRQQLPSEWDSVTVRVGYFDEVVGLSAWPSLAVSYLVADGVELDLSLTMQQERYVPSPSVSVASALAAIEADLASYRGIHYQLAQPDLDFALQTTLSLDSEGKPRSYPLAKVPFLAFARGAYVQLAALATLEKVEADAGGIELTALAERYGVTPAQLLEANGSTLYSALFGATALQVPKTWTTIAGDTLAAIAKRFGLSVEKLARDNEDAPLDPGTSLTTPARTVEASAGARLADLAAAARASVPGLATANEAREGILTTGARLTLGTATYPVAPNDSLAKAAAALKAPVAAVAVANQFLPDLFVAGTQLQVTDVVAGDGDTLGRLAAGFDPSGVASLAEANEEVANLFAPATSLEVGIEGSVEGPLPSDTLLSFARANRLTVEQLAGANGAAAFAAGAKPTIPATLTQGEGPRWCTHRAGEDATLAKIGGLFGVQPADVVALNPDLPGLLAAGQTIRDSGSGSSVTTAAEDSFASIVARFRSEHGVTVTLPQLAADVATQAGLLLDSGLWICPPMRGDAYGANSKGTLKELAGAYGVEPATIAIANAATIGLFAEGVPLKLPGWPDPPITTGPYETFNSLVTRLAAKDVEMTVEEVAKAVDAVEGLIAKEAGVVAVPPPPPPCSTPVQPSFTEPVFQLRVEVVAERNRNLIDPEFTGAPAVAVAATTIAAHPDPGGSKTLSLTEFAEKLQEALPGLAVAAGDPAVEGEPTASSTVWCVDFGPGRTGLRYTLKPDAANYYALPPLSRELMAGRVEVAPYESGKGLGETKLPRNFQAIDLDAWLNRFFAAVDVFLSPASVVGAYVAAPKQVEAVIDAKRRLADRVSRRIETVLGEEPGPAAEKAAEERMLQALLQKLGNATSVSTLVQLPAGVESPYLKSKGATRLSGRLVPRTARPADETDAYSFSTAKLPMVDGESNATFLLSVKAPEESSQLSVEVEYSVSEIELPAPGARIDDYEGSSWLKLVLPAAPGTALPLDVPVPLRAYPSPVTLASQTATQTVEKPAKASDLLGWEMQFVYQHADAEQDAALVEVAFDPRVEAAGAGRADDLDLDAIFAALAQFAEVEGALSDDLAKLAPQPPGKANPITTKAVEAFATIATGVALAFESKAAPAAVEPTPETFCYRLVREQNKGGTLARLAITAVEPETGKPMPNPVHVWPGVWVTIGKEQVRLAQEGEPTEIEARYAYPAGIEASEPLEERFAFALGGGEPALPELPQTGATLAGPKLFAFEDVDVLSRQNGRAGVSIWRNWSLVGGKTTNPSFVYQTPTARFPGLATPTVTAGGAIELGAAPTPLAQALGEFFKQLTTSRDNWEPEDGLQLRIGCGYAYTVADSDEGDTDLTAVVPCFLVPSTEFHPAAATAPTPRPADWDWEQPASFVSQVAAMAEAWRKEQQPSTRGAAFSFDLTAYAGGGQLQPLIRAGGLRYELG